MNTYTQAEETRDFESFFLPHHGPISRFSLYSALAPPPPHSF